MCPGCAERDARITWLEAEASRAVAERDAALDERDEALRRAEAWRSDVLLAAQREAGAERGG